MNVIERARKYILKCPPAISGQGGHNATFHVAAVLVHGFALSEFDALQLLREWNGSCLPPWSESDLLHKIRSAANAAHQNPRGWLLDENESPQGQSISQSVPLPKAAFKPETLKRIAGRVSEVEDVIDFIGQRSPVRVDVQDSASVLRRLYPRESREKVLIFADMKSQGQFLWEADKSDEIQNRRLPTGKEGVWFLPQPVSGEFLPNPRMDGKLSRRSEESVTSWRYAVLESDKADADEWLRCLVQLPLRIACVCESGGRSIHALVRIDAASKAAWDERIRAIKPILVTLGADPGALSAVRLSRLPQAMRGGKLQRLLFLNPQPEGAPILRQNLRGNRYEGEKGE